jgi:hypothetical protein
VFTVDASEPLLIERLERVVDGQLSLSRDGCQPAKVFVRKFEIECVVELSSVLKKTYRFVDSLLSQRSFTFLTFIILFISSVPLVRA